MDGRMSGSNFYVKSKGGNLVAAQFVTSNGIPITDPYLSMASDGITATIKSVPLYDAFGRVFPLNTWGMPGIFQPLVVFFQA
jgi:hypothetical protein